MITGMCLPRDAVFAARDRCGETVDRIRSVRTEQFKYIRNFHPQRPLLQPNDCKDAKPILPPLRELHARGKLATFRHASLLVPWFSNRTTSRANSPKLQFQAPGP